ncbi:MULTISPECIES: hypothetical protein [unclassified Microbacterium]|nr:hypothetical protein [Microbacterium sp.]
MADPDGGGPHPHFVRQEFRGSFDLPHLEGSMGLMEYGGAHRESFVVN